jgi:hypothetical protein
MGESTGDYPITGLTDETTYSVATAAVDGSGNVGPAASPLCATPIVDAGTFDAAFDDDAGLVDAAPNEAPKTETAGCACSQGVPTGPAHAPPAAIAAVAMVIALARRRRIGS